MAIKKLHILCISFLLLGVFAYLFSIKNTVDIYGDNKKKEVELMRLQSAPQQIAALESQLSNFENAINKHSYNREEIFESINTFCSSNNLKLSYFHPEQRENSNEIKIITNKIEVEGSYKNIVKLAYEIERIQELGHLSSLNFEKKKERRSKREYLTGILYLRHIISL